MKINKNIIIVSYSNYNEIYTIEYTYSQFMRVCRFYGIRQLMIRKSSVEQLKTMLCVN